MKKSKNLKEKAKDTRKKNNTKQQGRLDIDYMRKEIQKIIDNHLKGKSSRFSVENREFEKLKLLADFLWWKITRKDIEKKYKQDKKNLSNTYDEILNEYNIMLSLYNLNNNTQNDLSKLKEDLLLGDRLNTI